MIPAAPPALAVFDLCETLYAQNTTLGFVRFFLARHGSRTSRTMLELLCSRRSPAYYLLAVLHRFLAVDLYRPALARALKGRSRDELGSAARIYAAETLPRVPVPAMLTRLEQHRAAGDRLAIVSNSLDVIVEAVAARLGTEWRASRLEFRGGLCTGRIAEDLSGRKSAILAELLAVQPVRPLVHVYTDNLSDRDLVAAADRATIVIPAGHSRNRWGSIDADFVEL